MTSSPAPRSALAAALTALTALAVVLAGLVGVPTPASAVATPTATAPATVAQRPPGPGADFPQLPQRCYDADRLPRSPCRVTTYRGRPYIVLWGDSHAWMYLPAVRKLAKSRRLNLVMTSLGGCPVALPLRDGKSGSCEQHNAEVLQYLRGLRDRGVSFRVLVGTFWAGYIRVHRITQRGTAGSEQISDFHKRMAKLAVKGGPRMFQRLGSMRLPVDVIAPAATVPPNARTCVRGEDPYQCNLPRSQAMYSERSVDDWIDTRLLTPLRTPLLIDPSSTYCTRTVCRARVDGINTYYDDIHLGAGLTATMARFFAPQAARLLS